MKTTQKVDQRILYLTTLSKTELNTLVGQLPGLHVATGLKGEPVYVVSATINYKGNIKALLEKLGVTIKNSLDNYLTAWIPLHSVKKLARNRQIECIALNDN